MTAQMTSLLNLRRLLLKLVFTAGFDRLNPTLPSASRSSAEPDRGQSVLTC